MYSEASHRDVASSLPDPNFYITFSNHSGPCPSLVYIDLLTAFEAFSAGTSR